VSGGDEQGYIQGYDIRGVVGVDLDDELVREIGRAFATYMRERGKAKVSVGRDCRSAPTGSGPLPWKV